MNNFGFSFQIALADSLIFNIFLAIICIGIMYMMQFYLPQKNKLGYVISVSIISALLVILPSQLILKEIFFDDTLYLDFLQKSWPVRASIIFLLSACTSLISLVFYSMEEQKESEQRKHDAEQLSKEAELFNLRQQLQPHFLFNSLNSISALAGKKPEEARMMIQQLSDFLRGTIRKDTDQFIPLEQELNHLNLYLEIEKVRFGHRLKTEIIVNEPTAHLKIPSLLLQPLVENAIKFGLYDTLGEVTITIKSFLENQMLVLLIINPYDAASSPKKGTGFGLSGVQRRLYLLFGRNDLVNTSNENNLFTTRVKIPQIK